MVLRKSPAKSDEAKKPTALGGVFSKAAASAGAGFMAMVVQVLALMWLRTLINYQYSKGGTFTEAFSALYADGGIGRFYQGLLPALFVGPISRFGDTAANAGILALLDGALPTGAVTAIASCGAAVWRIFIMPITNMKTSMQVHGAPGFGMFMQKMSLDPTSPWEGTMGTMGSTWLGHFPWFLTNNLLSKYIKTDNGKDKSDPEYMEDDKFTKLCKRALIGFCSSFVSDCVSNGLRVVTTAKQTSAEPITYTAAAAAIIAADGLWGLFGRGLGTKIISNGISSMMFSVLWKHFEEKLKGAAAKKEE